MIEALEKSLGVVTYAAKSVGIDRVTHYRWCERDPTYKEAVNGIQEVALDFVESKLHQSISKGSDAATIFYLKTKGKNRGYIERQEITGKDGERLHETGNLDNLTVEEIKTLRKLQNKARGN